MQYSLYYGGLEPNLQYLRYAYISYQWDPTTGSLLCLVSFTWHDAFEICSYRVCQRVDSVHIPFYCGGIFLVRMYQELFIHSPANGHVYCVHFWLLGKLRCEHLCTGFWVKHVFSFLLGKYRGVRWLDHGVTA